MNYVEAFGPVPVPAPPGFFRALLVGTFWFHLMAVQLLLGLLVISWARAVVGRGAETGPDRGIRHLPATMAILINLGIPPLLFLQLIYGPVFYTSSILLGSLWMGVIPLLMLAYGGLYLARYSPRRQCVPLYLGTSLFLVLVIAYLFSNNMAWMLRPGDFAAAYQNGASGGHLYPDQAQVFFRWLWVLSPAFALGAAWLEGDRRWAWLTVAAGIAGAAVLQGRGAPGVSGVFFALDYVLLAALAVMLLAVQDSARWRKMVLHWAILKAALIVVIRDQIRQQALAKEGFTLDLLAQSNLLSTTWLPLVLFLLMLAGAIGILGWMWSRGRQGVTL
ncbi:MAG: hypothetical protein HYU36_02050 [Planctomycetes bacterium]|nr:hypothetical protein [Planctomycetota bacterium]